VDYVISIADQLAPQLRSLRKARRLGQADLAIKLGLSQSRIAAIERNPAAVSAGQLLEILKVLGVALVLRDTTSVANDISPQPDISDKTRQGEW
jgi:HTH-type transcriptional regulator/antitoxin HipB